MRDLSRGAILLVILAGLLAGRASCQTRKGAIELNLAGSLSGAHPVSSHDTTWLGVLAVSSGYFFSPRNEVGFNFSLTAPESTPAEHDFVGFGTAYFPHSKTSVVVPFLGIEMGSHVGVYCGIKGFLGPRAAIFLQPYYQRHGSAGYWTEHYGVLTGISVFLR